MQKKKKKNSKRTEWVQEQRKFKLCNCNFIFNTKEGSKGGTEEQKEHWTQKTKNTVAGIKTTLTIITLIVERLNTSTKGKYSTTKFKKSYHMLLYSKTQIGLKE